jgi:hypothetical protein
VCGFFSGAPCCGLALTADWFGCFFHGSISLFFNKSNFFSHI